MDPDELLCIYLMSTSLKPVHINFSFLFLGGWGWELGCSYSSSTFSPLLLLLLLLHLTSAHLPRGAASQRCADHSSLRCCTEDINTEISAGITAEQGQQWQQGGQLLQDTWQGSTGTEHFFQDIRTHRPPGWRCPRAPRGQALEMTPGQN